MAVSMKPPKQDRKTNKGGFGILLLAATLVGAPLSSGSAEQVETAAAPSAGAQAATGLAKRPDGIEPILKMMKAGVSKDVIKLYIESSRPLALTPDDLIKLKDAAVPDDITTAMLKRSAEAKAQAGPAKASLTAPPGVTGFRGMDPESYEFWWYHYAYPRTLAYANERLYPDYPPYGCGPYHPWPPGAFAFGYPRPGFPTAAGSRSVLQNRAAQGQIRLGNPAPFPLSR